jgi:GT2 family glycosyltransferase
MNKIGIVVPVLNNFKGLCEALESVRTSHIWTPYIIPNWRINQCVSWAWNDGTRHAIADGCDYILIINDDILFGPHTIDVLVDHLDNHPECVMATACNIQEELPDPYAIFTYEADKPELISPHPDFSCFMVRPDIFEKIGTFDENFKPAYFEDNDYHRR